MSSTSSFMNYFMSLSVITIFIKALPGNYIYDVDFAGRMTGVWCSHPVCSIALGLQS